MITIVRGDGSSDVDLQPHRIELHRSHRVLFVLLYIFRRLFSFFLLCTPRALWRMTLSPPWPRLRTLI